MPIDDALRLLDTLHGLRICHNNARERGHITAAEHRTAVTAIDTDIYTLRHALGNPAGDGLDI